MTTIKIKQLTGSNVNDLRKLDVADELGATYAVFRDVGPGGAVERVYGARDRLAATLSASERRGLANSVGSIVRKLTGTDASGGKHTIVTES